MAVGLERVNDWILRVESWTPSWDILGKATYIPLSLLARFLHSCGLPEARPSSAGIAGGLTGRGR